MDRHTKIFLAGITALSISSAYILYAIQHHPTATDERKFTIIKYSAGTIATVGLLLIATSHLFTEKPTA